mmetsp:Transcript_31153/g.85353  ORF Transcript_31153/g.85353 Transcript_31153/m.85353 type:complete len:565 (-) Transcript_31153:88-1782(-)
MLPVPAPAPTPTQVAQALPPASPAPTGEEVEEPTVPFDRNKFEDDFPVMFKFYRERGILPEFHMQKVQEIQRRWKTGLVFWLTHDNQEIEIPEWVAVNVVINNKQNVQRGARICMSLNHTKGYGCNRRNEGACSYVHECALCGQEDHGVFQKRQNGSWMCSKLRKWNEEEERFQTSGYGDPWKQEEVLTEMARKPRATAPSSISAGPTALSSAGCRSAMPCTSVGFGALGTGPPAALGTSAVVARSPAAAASILAAVSTRAIGTAPGSARLCSSAAPPRPSMLSSETAGASGAPFGGICGAPTCLVDSACAGLQISTMQPPPAQPPPPRLPPHWQAIWSDEQAKYYYWHRPTNYTTWETPDASPELLGGTMASREGLGDSTSFTFDTRQEAIPEARNAADAFVKVDPESETGRQFLCVQHWRPQVGIDYCMRIIQGDRLVITWSSGEERGWVYGHALDDPCRAGYVPRSVITHASADSRCRSTGELCTVNKHFEGPEEVGGYLAVLPGDILRIAAAMEPPYVWAYAERTGGSKPEVGWVPEAVLQDIVYAAGVALNEPWMHPAG